MCEDINQHLKHLLYKFVLGQVVRLMVRPVMLLKDCNLYIYLKEYLAAVDDLNQAIDRQPLHVDAYNNRAASLYELGHSEMAIRDADRAIELNPKQSAAYAVRSLANADLGREDEAKGDFSMAKDLGFDHHLLFHLLQRARKGQRLN